jgi:replicative DNA helicase
VLVDYLQCIGTARATQDRRAEINHIARTLFDAVKTSGAAGVLASQITGENVRESRDVEHAAEVVLIGRRETEPPGARKKPPHAMTLFVKKNKCGPKDAVIDLEWEELNGSFRTELPDEYEGLGWDSVEQEPEARRARA